MRKLLRSACFLVMVPFALVLGDTQAQQKGKLSPPDFAQARVAYCKGHEALAALGYLRHRPGHDDHALPLVIQNDFRTLRGADLRMRIWSLNYGMNVAASEQDAKRGAFKHCVEGFAPVMEQRRMR